MESKWVLKYTVMDKAIGCRINPDYGNYACLSNMYDSIQETILKGEILFVHQIIFRCEKLDISEYHPGHMCIFDLPEWLSNLPSLRATKRESSPKRKRPRVFLYNTLFDEKHTEQFYGAENNPKKIPKQTNDSEIRVSKRPAL